MRILITTWPDFGHFHPMLPIARAAQHAGHDVVIATGPDFAPYIERRGFATWPVRPSLAEAIADFRAAYPDLLALSRDEHLQAAISGFFVAGAAKRAAELVPRAREWAPDVVIHEVTELAGALAAAHTSARHVVHGLGLMTPTLRQAFRPAFEPLCTRWQVPGLVDELYTATYLDICPPSLHLGGIRWWQSIQPLRPTAGEPTTGERLPEALAALPYQHTIHLTLGTIFSEAPGVLETAIAGLRELPLNLVVTTGPGTDPARLGPQPPHVLIEPYIAHALLLPRCHLVVSHGGAGIMFGALAHGMPQLILPQAADQFWNAAACQRAGAGLALLPEAFSAGAVAASAQRLITEPAFTVAARRIQSEINAMPTGEDVLADLLPAKLPIPAG